MSRRELIKMSPEEVDEFLSGRRTMNVATIGPSGHPHLVAMWYGFLDSKPAFWTYARSQKVVNLRRDPRLTCLVEDGDRYEELRGVELVGTGTIVEDREKVMELGENIYERYFGPVDDSSRPVIAQMGAKRVAVQIQVSRVVSWDHRKLGGVY
jgi:PPOX class probable F420-dependent enzyme